MASRRNQSRTDDSTASVASSLAANAALADQLVSRLLQEQNLKVMPALQILNRCLSIRSTISTTSSFATRQQVAHNSSQIVLEHIGQGLQATCYGLSGTDIVYKRAHNGSDNTEHLETEFESYQKLRKAWDTFPDMVKFVQLPKAFDFVDPRSEAGKDWWAAHATQFPSAHQKPTGVLVMERILPLPRVVRHALIDHFLPPPLSNQAASLKLSQQQKQCLARVYTGEHSTQSPDGILQRPIGAPRDPAVFNLRNFPLYADMMETLGLELDVFAKVLAGAYAVIHWAAKIDGDDIEFVLGTSVTKPEEGILDFQHRAMKLIVLDFGRCEPLELDEDGAQAAGAALIRNSPYTPRPSTKNAKAQELWDIFKDYYLFHSNAILEGAGMDESGLPEQVMEKVEQWYEDMEE
ncbi:hypothetical protein BU16DRAFT_521725 [Lophium mytilinum]|uniref:DUF3669 domain-containing protein n=1 Tax=Lophium mytilinum TaxID=390894 RepID=A0A6A6RF58_9PEZI|nr:hypothetical protein BU16DRAFT_521725 [Lophium mytilinum]